MHAAESTYPPSGPESLEHRLTKVESKNAELETRQDKTDATIERIDGRVLYVLLGLVVLLARSLGPDALTLITRLAAH